MFRTWHLGQSFMQIGIEGLPYRLNFGESISFENLVKLTTNQLDPLLERVGVLCLLVERTV